MILRPPPGSGESEGQTSPLLSLLAAIPRDPLLAATCPAIVFLPGKCRERVSHRFRQSRNVSTLEKVCRNAASTPRQEPAEAPARLK